MAVAKPAARIPVSKDVTFSWEGIDKNGKKIQGEILATSEAVANTSLRRQGIVVKRLRKKSSMARKRPITGKDVAIFTRQLATMLRAGVPLLQSFDIVAKGHSNPSMQKLLMTIKSDIEGGNSLSQSFSRHPLQFDALYINLVNAGEQAGILDAVLERLATYQEKTLALKSKIKSAMFYPAAVMTVAVVITSIIMLFVVPAFKKLFSSFGATLPTPTLILISISDFFVHWWWLIFGGLGAGIWFFLHTLKRSRTLQEAVDRLVLRLPIFGPILEKAAVARWTRTLATMFSAGVPLVDALTSVAGAAGNVVFYNATQKIRNEVSTGSSLTVSMQNTAIFPSMVLQMASIGEESGSLDSMLSKVADFYESEVDDAVAALSSLMEPLIMVILGTLIGSMVIAMYLPIFKMGSVVG